MEVQLSQLAVERDSASEESLGLQNQLHQTEDTVRTEPRHGPNPWV